MNNEQYLRIIEELMSRIGDGPGSHSDALLQISERYSETEELQQAVAKLSDSFDAIRLVIKYLLFDIEATRRERDEFRMLLEDRE